MQTNDRELDRLPKGQKKEGGVFVGPSPRNCPFCTETMTYKRTSRKINYWDCNRCGEIKEDIT